MHVHVEVGNVMIVHMTIRIMRLDNQALVNIVCANIRLRRVFN